MGSHTKAQAQGQAVAGAGAFYCRISRSLKGLKCKNALHVFINLSDLTWLDLFSNTLKNYNYLLKVKNIYPQFTV